MPAVDDDEERDGEERDGEERGDMVTLRTALSPHAGPTAVSVAVRGVQVIAVTVVTMVPAWLAGALAPRDVRRRRLAQRLASLAARLGPTFIKAAQVLGTRRDVLPPELCDELAVLQDDVAPMAKTQARAALLDAFGPKLHAVFDDVDLTAVASGSVACVYRARLATGRPVALKLRRPGIGPVMERDLVLLRRGAGLVARLPALSGVPVTDIVNQMADAVLTQLDFEREARALQRLRANLSVVPRVWVPRVYPEACRPGCIVMEFVPDLATGTARSCAPAVRRRFGASGLGAIYQMLFVDGFVHCDLHPGNLYFTTSGHVVVLDAGFSVQLEERVRRLFAEFFLNMAIGRGRRAAEIVVESSTGLSATADVPAFIERMAALVERSHSQSAQEFSLVAFASTMFDLQRRFGVFAAPEIVFPLLALLVIEGTVRDLDPDIDFQEAAKPALFKGLYGRQPS